jgi:hypothetical protein
MMFGALVRGFWFPGVLLVSLKRLGIIPDSVRNRGKHNGAMLPSSSAPVGRGAHGVVAMA